MTVSLKSVPIARYYSIIYCTAALTVWPALVSGNSGYVQDRLSGQLTVKCDNGVADGYMCSNVDLLSVLTPEDLGATETCTNNLPLRRCTMNDMWGWEDPFTGKEYILAGREDGTSFVDVTDPENPIYVGNLASNGTRPEWWRDMKVYNNHAYIVADKSAGDGMQIFDLTQLRNFSGAPIQFQSTSLFNGFVSAHNIFINEESGYAYVMGTSGANCPGLYMVNLSDQLNPEFVGCYIGTGIVSSSDTHDAQCVNYRGPDADYFGHEICLIANETHLVIADVTDKSNVVSISNISHPSSRYVHQGWLTENQEFFIQNDELDELYNNQVTTTRTIFWDVKDLDDPVEAIVYNAQTPDVDHNLYVKGDFVYQANYTAGLRILDISDAGNPREVGFFDTSDIMLGEVGYDVFGGAWSNYPFLKSGAVAINSALEGLFLVRPTFSTGTTVQDSELSANLELTRAFPNPFTDDFTVEISVPTDQMVVVSLVNVLGQEITQTSIRFVSRDGASFEIDGSMVPPGTYFLKVSGETFVSTHTITKVR